MQPKLKLPKTVIDDDRVLQAIADISKSRLCLRCKMEFVSSGFGDRICRRCKGTKAWRNGVATTYGKSSKW